MEDIITDMRAKAIKIQTIDMAGSGGHIASAFTISFTYPDRFKAQAVVRELVTQFTEQNVTVQRNSAQLTSTFLGDEMKQANDKMDNAEQALTKFKSENMGRLRSEEHTSELQSPMY